MTTVTIMIVRHGEKPVDKPLGLLNDNYWGADVNGNGSGDTGSNSLIPQGWMRSGALGRFFAPRPGQKPPVNGIAVPTRLYAAASNAPCPETFHFGHKDPSPQQPPPIRRPAGPVSTQSMREQELLLGVSALLQLPIDATFTPDKTGNAALAKTVTSLEASSVALIAWEHKNIPELALDINAILGAKLEGQIPRKWDGERFDLVWVFAPTADGNAYTFAQIPQMILPGDMPSVMSLDGTSATEDE
jgi:hypothetical protein